MKSWNGQLGWTIGQWYTLVLRRWDYNGHTLYGWWTNNISTNKWTHLVTMDYPVADVYFTGGTASFLEDWTASGQNVRRFEMKDGFKRTKDGVWHPFIKHRFSVNSGDATGRSANYKLAYDAGYTSNNAIYYQTGGNTRNTCSKNCYLTQNPGPQPSNPTITFLFVKANAQNIEWFVPPSSTPQFKFTINVNGAQYVSSIEAERRSYLIPVLKNLDVVELVLEDILGRTASQKKVVIN